MSNEFIQQPSTLFEIYFNIILFIHTKVFQVASFIQVFQLILCTIMDFSSDPCMIHVPHM